MEGEQGHAACCVRRHSATAETVDPVSPALGLLAGTVLVVALQGKNNVLHVR